MDNMKITLLTVLLAAFLNRVGQAAPTLPQNLTNKLLYILIDGFRYDYVDSQPADALPGFTRFLEEGVRAEYMNPIFPSNSYPNWNTLITGLWAESHGIIGNYIYDDEEKDKFHIEQPDTTGQTKWWSAEPIWTTATKAGVKTGVIRWSNCELYFDGIIPAYCTPYDSKEQEPESFQTNIEKAIEMLKGDYTFVQTYTQYIDTAGHYQGPETEGLKEAVRSADKTILYILDQLESNGLSQTVNIIIVSDHGMKDSTPEVLQHVEVDDYLDIDLVEKIIDTGAFLNIKTLPGFVDQVYESLQEMPGVEVYLHDNIPEELHYKDHKFVHDILLIADSNTYILPSRSNNKQHPVRKAVEVVGAHGFDSEEEKMRAIFFAKGPHFKMNETIPAIQAVDVYPLLAELLNIDPLPNNGTLSVVKQALEIRKTGVLPICALIRNCDIPYSNTCSAVKLEGRK